MISQALRGADALAGDPNPSLDQWTRFYAIGTVQIDILSGHWLPKTRAMFVIVWLNSLSVELLGLC